MQNGAYSNAARIAVHTYPPPRRRGFCSGSWGTAKIQRLVLEFTVTRFGTVKDIVVLESEPPGVFDESAIQAAGKFKYKPTVEDGRPVEVPAVKNKIVYKLDDSLK